MTAQIIYGHDFKAKAEKHFNAVEVAELDRIIRDALRGSGTNVTADHFTAPDKDPE